MAITKIVSGANATIIKLADGTVLSLSAYKQSASVLPIVGVMQGAFMPLVINDAGAHVDLVSHLRSTGGELVAKLASGGYQELVQDDTGGIMNISQFQQAEEAAAAAVLSTEKVVQFAKTKQSKVKTTKAKQSKTKAAKTKATKK